MDEFEGEEVGWRWDGDAAVQWGKMGRP